MIKKVKIFVLFSVLSLCSFGLFAEEKKADPKATVSEQAAPVEEQKPAPAPAKKKAAKVESIKVQNLNSWQEEFDLESRKKGKYNIMITAEDLGGNTYVEGPYNIYVDPDSDKPICGITSPYPNMRVVGNLNIVGTAVDDDGVSKITLILDEGTDYEKEVTADGQEFWSYYLDTNDLEEGPHTIKVIGYDINEKPVASDPYVLTWQLDRKLPVTQVQDKAMGLLVAGKVHFAGTVNDGNGIKQLEYSVDGGKYFIPIKLKKTKDKATKTFDISVDTRKFEDGPSVLWFRAEDMAGSVGLYSFLYFIDNTKPEVKIVSPTPEQVMNGKITVTGYAKDKIGVTDLSWTFGKESGVIDLIPGNPYWAVNLDTTGGKEKSQKFSITAVDKSNNSVTVTQNIILNQENDLPVIKLAEPVEGQIYTENDYVYVRGLITDDDRVASVKIQLDNQEPIVQENNGVYVKKILEPGQLPAGNHKITVIAKDINGVESVPLVTNIVSKGVAPLISTPKVNGKDFVNGMEIHPESGSKIEVKVDTPFGLKNVHYFIESAGQKIAEEDFVIEKKNNHSFVINVNPDSAKGVMKLNVTATDNLDRVSEFKGIYYVTNTTIVNNRDADPKLVFDDSRIDENGVIINNEEFPVTGYVIGAKAASVELVPSTPFAKASLNGNQVKLTAVKAEGQSEPVVVKVRLSNGRSVTSQPLVFKSETVHPKLVLDDVNNESPIVAGFEPVTISGSASSVSGINKVSYRIVPIQTEMKKGIIGAIKQGVASEFTDLDIDNKGRFSITVDTESLTAGLYVVDVVAESKGGLKSSKVAVISTIPELAEFEGVMPVARKPEIVWIDSADVYGIGVYQGTLDKVVSAFTREEMKEGENLLSMTITATDVAAEVPLTATSQYKANKDYTLDANIALVNGAEYLSGMPVIMSYGAAGTGTVTIYVDSSVPVSGVSYVISGDNVPGGSVESKGSAKITKPSEDKPNRWIAEIPLANLPARVTKINATVKAGSLTKTIKGSIAVIRSKDNILIDDKASVYGYAGTNTHYDEATGAYILNKGSSYTYYANVEGPITADVSASNSGLVADVNGKFITVTATKDGYYNDVVVKVVDRFGDVHKSKAINFIADTAVPVINISTPVTLDWVKNYIKLSGTVTDAVGIKSVEYSLDKGANWHLFNIKSGQVGITFNTDVDLRALEEGLITIDIRATDIAGNVACAYSSNYKDVTSPVVSVVQPLDVDVVNGTNLIVFDAKDNVTLDSVEYVAPGNKSKSEVPLNPLVSTFVGTKENPIDDKMSFVFKDPAGNKTEVGAWKFSIDQKSDLPVTEIHVPEENQVITRDFTISGIVYDDDGDSTIYYTIDDGEYKKVSTHEVYKQDNPNAEYKLNSSYSIDVPFETMTDNEHVISVYAVDVNGVKGLKATRTFRISTEEPKGSVEKPTIDTSVRNLVTISGVASDNNGIEKVQISLDNGCSYNDAVGTTNWTYTVDSRAIPGGTQVVFLKVFDKYGIQGLYSSLINIDNDAPVLNLELPLDDSTTSGTLFFSGYTYDNVAVKDLKVKIRNLEGGSRTIEKDLKIDSIIGETIDISNLPDGFYNVEVTGRDDAENVTNVSRNIHLKKRSAPAVIDILYPLNGEHKQGVFTIYGQTETEEEITGLELFIDGKSVQKTTVTSSEFYKFELGPENISEGDHKYRVDAYLDNGAKVSSREQYITYSAAGPWVTIDNFTYGDFAVDRPYIQGKAGYSVSPDELLMLKSKDVSKEQKTAIANKSVAKVEISFDNGKTFTLISEKPEWKYRVENQDLPAGYHFMLVKATMKNGEVAINRTIIQIDNTRPTVKLRAPAIGGRYNQSLSVSGLSSDDVLLEDVTVTLRKGDKASYEVPSFIQGLYLDCKFWGASLFQVGAGLTFFDDVVKLQASYGQFTQEQRDAVSQFIGIDMTNMRYGGHIVSLKILANIASLPFSYFFGHDWDWLYATFALGADFSWFSETNSGKPQILSALIGQIEFPKAKFAKAKAFSSLAMYTEAAVWFIPTDVASDTGIDIKNLIPQIGVGVRVNIF